MISATEKPYSNCIDQLKILKSYEQVLANHGIDHLKDGFYYRALLKLEASPHDLFTALQTTIRVRNLNLIVQKSDARQIAGSYRRRSLKAKVFYGLINHLVEVKDAAAAPQIIPTKEPAKKFKRTPAHQQLSKTLNKRPARKSSNKENAPKNNTLRLKSGSSNPGSHRASTQALAEMENSATTHCPEVSKAGEPLINY